MRTPARLLVVDDEPTVRSSLKEILEHEGHEVVTAASGEEALLKLRSVSFDLALVDLKMPGIDGLQVMAEARSISPDIVVVMLTAYGTLDSAIGALRHGAHDYLLKPCKVEEIVASVESGLTKRRLRIRRQELVHRIEASVRQLKAEAPAFEPSAEQPLQPRFLRTGHLLVDREKLLVLVNGEPLTLTPTEFRLLTCLMENVNHALSYRELAQQAQDYDCSEQEARSALKTHVWRLRRKLKARMGDASCIVNVRGKGYMLSL